jgi:hypothetical protein
MGRYANPPLAVKAQGRALSGSSYTSLSEQLRPGEMLFGLFDQIILKVAPLLDSKDEFNWHYGAYEEGQYVNVSFYALSPEVASALGA